MTKICGYNCEHNKGGQCQITYCDKIGEITTTTQWLSGGRQQGKTYQLIKNQQKEIERLNNIINETLKELEKIGDFYTTPIGEVIHLKDKILHINKAINKLKEGKENEKNI